jgi:hypothetical protein
MCNVCLQLFLSSRSFYQGRPNRLRPAYSNPNPAVLLLNTPSLGRDQQFGAFNFSEVAVSALGLRYTPGVLQFALGPVLPMINMLYNYTMLWNNFSDPIAESCEVDPVSLFPAFNPLALAVS